MNDKKLAQKLKQGSRSALNRAMDAYTRYLSAVAWNAMGPTATAEDVEEVVSDAFLALWSRRDSLQPEQGLKSWLAAVARNKAVDRLRAAPPPPLPLDEAGGAGGSTPEDELSGGCSPTRCAARWRTCRPRTTSWSCASTMRMSRSRTSPGTWDCPSRRPNPGCAGPAEN